MSRKDRQGHKSPDHKGRQHPASIEALTKEIIAFRDERDWKQFHNAKDLAIGAIL